MLLAGGARAILLQIAHPAVGRGVAEHSDLATRPLDLLAAKHAPPLLKAAMPANRFLTTAWLPEPIRRQYGLAWGAGDQRRYDMLGRLGSPLYRCVPALLREAPKTYYLRQMRRRPINSP